MNQVEPLFNLRQPVRIIIDLLAVSAELVEQVRARIDQVQNDLGPVSPVRVQPHDPVQTALQRVQLVDNPRLTFAASL